jgi:hypothetical protein
MTPTTSDRFSALAARVESALPDAGFTKEQAAELVGSLRAYWEHHTDETATARDATFARIDGEAKGQVDLERREVHALRFLDRASRVFYANDPKHTEESATGYLDWCERFLEPTP